MRRIVNAVRLQLTNPALYFWQPIVILLASSGVALLIMSAIPSSSEKFAYAANAPIWFYLFFGIQGLVAFFPFALALGLTRWEYLIGACAAAMLSASALATTFVALGLIEKATQGWGLNAYVAYLPWVWSRGALGAWALVWALAFGFYVVGFGLAVLYKWAGLWAVTVPALSVLLVLAAALFLAARTGQWDRFFGWVTRLQVVPVATATAAASAVLAAVTYPALRRLGAG